MEICDISIFYFKRKYNMYDKQEVISLDEWIDITHDVAQALYDAGMDEKHRFKVLAILESQNEKFIKFSNESKEILKRASHTDATHIGQRFNASFYVALEGRDFWFDTKKRQWKLCEWVETCLDDTELYLKIKFE